jgi:hypothetical protein
MQDSNSGSISKRGGTGTEGKRANLPTLHAAITGTPSDNGHADSQLEVRDFWKSVIHVAVEAGDQLKK